MSKEKKKKNPNTYSFSLKKTDGKIIRDFIDKQSNFSETVRFLITKYVIENGIEDVSGKLNELLFLALENNIYTLEKSNISILNEEDKYESNLSKEIKDNEDQKEEFSIEEVPNCYKIN